MPYKRSKYYSTKKVVVKPKVHWALSRNTAALTLDMPAANAQSTGFAHETMYQYKTQTLCDANADNIYQPGLTKKVKHIKVDITKIKHNIADLDKHLCKLKAYIVYMPQGVNFETKDQANQLMNLAQTLVHHPEWIMAEKNINPNGTDASTGNLTNTLSCKLSRNLKSGDRVILVIAGYFTGLSQYDYSAHKADKVNFNLEWSYASCL